MFDILAKLLSKEKTTTLERQVIYQLNDGSYNLFGTYIIKKHQETYIVEKNHTYTSHTFSELKNAVTWVTLDKCQNINDAARILFLDGLLAGVSHNILVHETLAKKVSDSDQRAVYATKLNEDRLKKQSILQEMNHYIQKCKSWQYRQFEINAAK